MADQVSTYSIKSTNWYKSFPYGFAFKPNSFPPVTEIVWLPIAPSNLTVTTHYATNVITTLYGIVEEHSEVRYFDIIISGNTGFAPRYDSKSGFSAIGADVTTAATNVKNQVGNIANALTSNLGKPPSVGRGSFDPSFASKLSFGGFLSEATNTATAIAELAIDTAKSLTGINPNSTGIEPSKSGYVAFHNLYQFFLRYKEDANPQPPLSVGPISIPSPNRHRHPLQFLNYKDGVKYDAIPISFNLTRSADNPMLYQYSIKLRCFNLQSVDGGEFLTQNLLAELGLNGVRGSAFAKLTSITNNAATLVSGIAGAL